MKKLSILLLFISSFCMAQTWENDHRAFKNSFDDPYSQTDGPVRTCGDELSRKKEREINQEMTYFKRVIRQGGNIFGMLQKEDNENPESHDQQGMSGPGAPGEPVPIDHQTGWLLLLGVILILNAATKEKYRKAN